MTEAESKCSKRSTAVVIANASAPSRGERFDQIWAPVKELIRYYERDDQHLHWLPAVQVQQVAEDSRQAAGEIKSLPLQDYTSVVGVLMMDEGNRGVVNLSPDQQSNSLIDTYQALKAVSQDHVIVIWCRDENSRQLSLAVCSEPVQMKLSSQLVGRTDSLNGLVMSIYKSMSTAQAMAFIRFWLHMPHSEHLQPLPEDVEPYMFKSRQTRPRGDRPRRQRQLRGDSRRYSSLGGSEEEEDNGGTINSSEDEMFPGPWEPAKCDVVKGGKKMTSATLYPRKVNVIYRSGADTQEIRSQIQTLKSQYIPQSQALHIEDFSYKDILDLSICSGADIVFLVASADDIADMEQSKLDSVVQQVMKTDGLRKLFVCLAYDRGFLNAGGASIEHCVSSDVRNAVSGQSLFQSDRIEVLSWFSRPSQAVANRIKDEVLLACQEPQKITGGGSYPLSDVMLFLLCSALLGSFGALVFYSARAVAYLLRNV